MREALANGDIEDLSRILDLLIAISPEQPRQGDQESAPQECKANMDIMEEDEEDSHSKNDTEEIGANHQGPTREIVIPRIPVQIDAKIDDCNDTHERIKHEVGSIHDSPKGWSP